MGTKIDLKDAREVSKEAAEKYATNLGVLYFETSSLTDIKVTEAFHKAFDYAIQFRDEESDSFFGNAGLDF